MTPPLVNHYQNPITGIVSRFEYVHADSFDDIDPETVRQVYAVCLVDNQMIVVRTERAWILPGGTREPGESIEQTLRREVQEETNMEVIEWKPIGIQKVYEDNIEPYLQLRVVCRVKPFGPFESDPDGDILEIKLINPAIYREFFDWGEIGDAIVARARTLMENM